MRGVTVCTRVRSFISEWNLLRKTTKNTSNILVFDNFDKLLGHFYELPDYENILKRGVDGSDLLQN